MMSLIAHILNVVTKKFVLFQQLCKIVWGIWLLTECIVSTNQYRNFGHNMAVEATQFI